MFRNKIYLSLILSSSILFNACGAKLDLLSHGESDKSLDQPTTTTPQGQGNGGNGTTQPPVCDPFTHEPTTSNVSGLKTILKYKDSHKKWIHSVNQVLWCGKKAPIDLYFNRVFVPTMNWTEGFTQPDGTKVKDKKGNVVIDSFALKMKTRVVLKEGQEEGYYQFALLSNDGSRASIKHPHIPFLINIVNDDGIHETKFKCSCFGVHMQKDKPLQLVVKYLQGPAPTMTNVLMWRKLENPKRKKHFVHAPHEDVCGMKGDDQFFEINTGIEKDGYKKLIAKGFRPLDAENFILPEDGQTNPCAAQ